MKTRSVIFLLFVLINSAFGQDFLEIDTTRFIEWEEGRPLTWADYQIKTDIDHEESAYALTSVIHSVRGGLINNKPNFRVHVLYVKRDSWSTTNQNQSLLAHERLHFDLAELYGRKIRKEIESLGRQGDQDLINYKKRIGWFLNEFKSKSIEYDNETNHGQLKERQQIWNEFVAYELNRLHKYKTTY